MNEGWRVNVFCPRGHLQSVPVDNYGEFVCESCSSVRREPTFFERWRMRRAIRRLERGA